MKKTKKLIAMLLTLMMLLSILPVAAFAETTPDYFSVTNTGNGTATLKWMKTGSPTVPELRYSTDGVNFSDPITIGSSSEATPITLEKGKTVYFKGDYSKANITSTSYIRLFGNGDGATLKVGGDLTTLLDGKGNATSLTKHIFAGLFNGNSILVNASELKLPSTVAEGCYYRMFYGCKALENAPELPATTLAPNCYNQMFQNCTALKSLTVGFSKFDPSNATENWLNGASTSGKAYVPDNLGSYTRGVSTFPSDWEIVTMHNVTNARLQTAAATNHGYLTVDKEKNLNKNDVVTVTVVPADGCTYVADSLLVKYNDGEDKTITPTKVNGKDNVYTFAMPDCSVSVTAEFVSPHVHEAGNSYEAVDATCQAQGNVAWYSCTDANCTAHLDVSGNEIADKDFYIAINPDNHCGDKVLDDATVVVATCVAQGYTGDYICSECGEVVEAGEVTDIDPDNHCGEAVLDDESVVAATCVAEGYTGDMICPDCEAVLEAGEATDIDPDNHATEGRTPVEAQEATCQHVGWDAYEECTCGEKLGYNEYPQLQHSYTGEVRDNGDMTHSFQCVNGCGEYGGTVPCVDEQDGDGICDICGATLDPYAQERADAIAKLEALVEGVEDETVQNMLAGYVEQIGKATSASAINRIVSSATSALKQQIEIANEGSLISLIRTFVNAVDRNNQKTTNKVMGIVKPILRIFGIK